MDIDGDAAEAAAAELDAGNAIGLAGDFALRTDGRQAHNMPRDRARPCLPGLAGRVRVAHAKPAPIHPPWGSLLND